MDLEFSYVGRYELADGTIVTKDVFTGQAEFDGELRDVEVSFAAGIAGNGGIGSQLREQNAQSGSVHSSPSFRILFLNRHSSSNRTSTARPIRSLSSAISW